jgi:hypothetical protein
MSSYNNYLRTKNGNLCCCPGAQGPKGSQGVRGPQGIQGIDGALKITRGSDVRNSQPEFILYDTSMIQLTPPSERNDSLGAYAIIGDDISFNVLPFGGDVSNNRPLDLNQRDRLNRSTWIKFKPNWKEIYPNNNTRPVKDEQYGYIPFYWSVPFR